MLQNRRGIGLGGDQLIDPGVGCWRVSLDDSCGHFRHRCVRFEVKPFDEMANERDQDRITLAAGRRAMCGSPGHAEVVPEPLLAFVDHTLEMGALMRGHPGQDRARPLRGSRDQASGLRIRTP